MVHCAFFLDLLVSAFRVVFLSEHGVEVPELSLEVEFSLDHMLLMLWLVLVVLDTRGDMLGVVFFEKLHETEL